MAYRDSSGNIVTGKEQNKKSQTEKHKFKVGTRFCYVGRTRSTGSRIVYYEMKITAYYPNSDTIDVEYLDRHIYINPNREIKELKGLPISIIK